MMREAAALLACTTVGAVVWAALGMIVGSLPEKLFLLGAVLAMLAAAWAVLGCYWFCRRQGWIEP